MKFVFALVTLLVVATPSMGKIYNRCSLAKEMHHLGVPKADLNKWVCIAQHESSFNTAAVGPPNKNGSRDYGIFQINNKYWCKPPSGSSYNECNISCNSLLSDDISASVKCALKVKKQQGWTAWSTWKFCDGSLPSINNCF